MQQEPPSHGLAINNGNGTAAAFAANGSVAPFVECDCDGGGKQRRRKVAPAGAAAAALVAVVALFFAILSLCLAALTATRRCNALLSEEGRGDSDSGSWCGFSVSLLAAAALLQRTPPPAPLISSSPNSGGSSGDGSLLCRGFGGFLVSTEATDFLAGSSSTATEEEATAAPPPPLCPMHWYCAPDSWDTKGETAPREGKDGSWSANNGTTPVLTIRPPAQKDYWRITYYEPTVLKDDAPFAYVELDESDYYTITAGFDHRVAMPHDQAGLMVRLDAQHWIAAGVIAVVESGDGDGSEGLLVPRLSVVVTNHYSDLSEHPNPHYSTTAAAAAAAATNLTTAFAATATTATVSCRVRIHMRAGHYVVQAWLDDDDGNCGKWETLRVTRLNRRMVYYPLAPLPSSSGAAATEAAADNRPSRGGGPSVFAGVYAACPRDQRGAEAVFWDFEVARGSDVNL